MPCSHCCRRPGGSARHSKPLAAAAATSVSSSCSQRAPADACRQLVAARCCAGSLRCDFLQHVGAQSGVIRLCMQGRCAGSEEAHVLKLAQRPTGVGTAAVVWLHTSSMHMSRDVGCLMSADSGCRDSQIEMMSQPRTRRYGTDAAIAGCAALSICPRAAMLVVRSVSCLAALTMVFASSCWSGLAATSCSTLDNTTDF